MKTLSLSNLGASNQRDYGIVAGHIHDTKFGQRFLRILAMVH